jgi:hypothetical protein
MTTDTTRQADAAAGAPEMPEPFGYVSDGGPDCMLFQHQPWPPMHAITHSTAEVYRSAQLRAYGQAMAEHARRVALDELRECRDLLSAVETCSRNNFVTLAAERIEAIDAIRAAAQTQGGA